MTCSILEVANNEVIDRLTNGIDEYTCHLLSVLILRLFKNKLQGL